MATYLESNILKLAKADGVTHIATGAAIVHDNKILMVRRAQGDSLPGNYELPGGGLDEGETIVQGVIREVYEETGLIVSEVLSTLNGFDYSTPSKPKVRQINFLIKSKSYQITLNPDEHDDYQWVDKSNYASLTMTNSMLVCVSDILRELNI